MLTIAFALLLGRELEWERLQVDWIAETGTVKSLEDVLTTHEAELVRLLGDPRYAVRALARDELRRMGRDASLALAWGARLKDQEISSTSRLLRELLYVCRRCEGTGKCPCDHGKNHELRCGDGCSWNGYCVVCEGSGDVRWEMKWEPDAWMVDWIGDGRNGYIPVDRDLFGAEVTRLIEWEASDGLW